MLKVLEEAAEVFGAYQNDDYDAMQYECADVLQAVVNLMYSMAEDDEGDEFLMTDAYLMVHRANRDRGRYKR